MNPARLYRTGLGQSAGRYWLSGGIAAALTALTGLALFLSPAGGGLARLSFDLPFAMRANLSVTNAVIIYLDEASHRELNQPMMAPWDRSLHAQLVEQLTAQGARAIVFDILFTEASANPAADERLADAIQQSRRVILSGNFHPGTFLERETAPEAGGYWEERPYESFGAGAAGWGNVNFNPDPDYGVRRFFPAVRNVAGAASVPWLPAVVAEFAGASKDALRDDTPESRWLNYYGPPGAFPSISYFKAVETNRVVPGFFKDKIVFIGAQLSADFSGKGKDEFLTPYSFWGHGFAPGVEIQATAALNILRGDWLVRLPFTLELGIFVLFAVAAGLGLIRLQPWTAVLLTLLTVVLLAMTARYLAWQHHLWFAWTIGVCQLAVALLCSVVFNSLRLFVEKKLLEQSLAVHLSPGLVKRVLSDPGLRRRGGVKQEVSLLFTDIENFSRLSETMHADDLVNLLNRYFETALACIHETDGTVMDLVGDAIFAIWNAPLEQPDHRERACRAALMLHQKLVELDASQRGLPLHTRVGLHAGVVFVGNIGSDERFDYAAVGENTNLASRVEGLNKHLGTNLLATREIQRASEDKLTSRLIGHVRLKGFSRAIEIHELLGPLSWRSRRAPGASGLRRRCSISATAALPKPKRRSTIPSGCARRPGATPRAWPADRQGTARRCFIWRGFPSCGRSRRRTIGSAR